MEIPELPYSRDFQEKVKMEVTIDDPEVEEFLFKLGTMKDNGTNPREAAVHKKHYEILTNITKYSEQQILQWSALFLQSCRTADLLAGRIMKEWYLAHKNIASEQSSVAKDVKETV